MTLITGSTRSATGWLVLLFVLLLAQEAQCEGGLTKRGLPTLTTTTASVEPSSYSNSTYSNSTASSSMSSSITFVPVIPSSGDNKYVYHSKHISGTVFIGVGSCLAAIISVVVAVWVIFGISAWHSARKEYRLKEMEEKYQYDPYFLTKSRSTSSSDSDESSDISEDILKKKSSRLSLYSLGSTSVLNLLNQAKSDQPDPANNTNTNNRRSMFISPTELLQSEANKSTVWTNDTPTGSYFDSPASVPLEAPFAQILGSATSLNAARPQVDLYTGTPISRDSNVDSNKNPNYRPPSVVLDQLLDDQESQA